MTTIRRNSFVKRNDRCPCGSGQKFKRCCSPEASKHANSYMKPVRYIDTGEEAARYVICDDTGVKFFSDKDNNIIVFQTRQDATAVALLEDFAAAAPGEINVAGVGPTKWEHLKEKLPYVEVADAAQGIALVRERMELQRNKLESMSDAVDPPEETPAPEQENVNES
jgi:hypothetical protein